VGGEIFRDPKENSLNSVEKNPGYLIDAQTKAEMKTLDVKWFNSVKREVVQIIRKFTA
jgi:hypothetical protein